MTQVFISYARQNRDFVKRLAEDLEKEGLEVWYDSPRLKGGMDWAPEIRKAIQQSEYFIVVLSPDSVKSKWVSREVLIADPLDEKHKLKIIPLLLQKCKLPIWSVERQYIDVQGRNYDLNFQDLRNALHLEPRVLTNEKLDCVILCGGYSTRLWPLTRDFSKVLVPVAGKPVLEYVIDFVQESLAINNIILSVNEKFAPQIYAYRDKYLSRGQCKHRIDVIVERSAEQKEKLGPIGALQYIISEPGPHAGARDLLVLGGDNIFGFCLDDFLSDIHKTGEFWSYNASYNHEGQIEDISQYGLIDGDDQGIAHRFVEKPQKGTFQYLNLSAACYFFKKKDVEAIAEYIKAKQDPDSLGGFVRWLIAKRRMMTWPFSSFWFDVGTPESLFRANRYFLVHPISNKVRMRNVRRKKQTYIDPSSHVSKSILGPNVYIGPGVTVERCTIQDSIIMEQCILKYSEIKNSLIGPESEIENLLVEGWIVGPKSKVLK